MVGLTVDHHRGRPAILGTEVHLVVDQAAGSGTDRRQRRAQVVRDGLQERALEGVALARDIGIAGGPGEAVLLQGLAHLVRDCGKEPGLGPVRRPGGPSAERPQRPDGASAGIDPDTVRLRRGSPPVDRSLPRVDRDPLRRFVAGPAAQDPVTRRLGRRRPGVGVGDRRPAGTAIVKGDPRAVEVRLATEDLHDPGEHVDGRRSGHQLAAHGEERPGLALAGDSRLFADSQQGGHLADQQADRQEQDEVEPLPGVGNREHVTGVDEQEVVQEEGGNRRRENSHATADEGHDGDRQDVDGRWVRHAEPELQQGNERGRAAECGDADRRRSQQGASAERVHARRVPRRPPRPGPWPRVVVRARWPAPSSARAGPPVVRARWPARRPRALARPSSARAGPPVVRARWPARRPRALVVLLPPAVADAAWASARPAGTTSDGFGASPRDRAPQLAFGRDRFAIAGPRNGRVGRRSVAEHAR